jgi:hypothetical protein
MYTRYIPCIKLFTGSLNTEIITCICYMSEDAVVNWDAIIHKNVRSKDGQDAGNVDAIIEGDTVVITSEGDRQEYNVPKSEIEGFNGAEVSLKIPFGELRKYKV